MTKSTLDADIRRSPQGIPFPSFPREVDLRAEARKGRRRLYPVTVAYSACGLTVLGLGAGRQPLVATTWFLGGVVAWTLLEYLAHRHVLHGVFPDGPGPLQHALHRSFDDLHWRHHLRPWDGRHINGVILDTLPFAALLAALSFLAPLPTAPAFVAGLIQSYVVEEWVHHSVHFYRFKGRYFSYIKRHHLYHHSPRGTDLAFGLTSGFWDMVFGTRICPEDRTLLYVRR